MLTDFVPARLAKNQALSRKVQAGMKEVLLEDHSKKRTRSLSIPVEPGAIETWAGYLARGLLWHHWKTLLDEGGDVEAYSLTEAGERYFASNIFGRPAERRVVASLGSGTFRYTGVQIPDNAQMSVWVVEPYGGALVSGDEGGPNNVSRCIGAFTAPLGTMAELLRSSGGPTPQ